MSTLLVRPLYSGQIISDEYTYDLSERVNVGGFYPYLYLHGAPAGTFTFEVSNIHGVIFSKSFTSADIKASLPTLDDYLRVFYPVIPDSPVQMDKTPFTCKLFADGVYSYNGGGFIGWVQQFEDIQNEMDYIPLNDDQNPLALRWKVLKEGILCQR